MQKNLVLKTIISVVMGLACLVMIYPFLVMVSTSLKSMKEIRAIEFSLIPKTAMFSNYAQAMSRGN